MPDPMPWIAAYGDSTQWGTGTNKKYTLANAPGFLNRLLLVRHPKAVVVNRGVPGLSTQKRWTGKDAGACRWDIEMVQEHANTFCAVGPDGGPYNNLPCGTDAYFVINNTLINDVVLDRGLNKQQFKEVYRKLIDTTRTSGRQFVIESPNPIWGRSAIEVEAFNGFATALQELAAEEKVWLIDQYLTIRECGVEWTKLMSDPRRPRVSR